MDAQRNSHQVYELGYRPASEALDMSVKTLLDGTSRRKRKRLRPNGDSSPPSRGGESSQTNLDRSAGEWMSGAGDVVLPPSGWDDWMEPIVDEDE